MSGSSGIEYVENSYKALGQDGQHFNGLITVPTNTAVPETIASALYHMSDHLPVIMEIQIGGDVGIFNNEQYINRIYVDQFNNLNVNLNKGFNCDALQIHDLYGKRVFTKNYISSNSIQENIQFLSFGIYIGSLLIDGNYTNFKFLLTN